MSAFRNSAIWYLGLSAYWFATSAKWFILLLVILPGQVKEIVPGGEKNTQWGLVFAIGATWAIIGPSLFGYVSDRLMPKLRSRGPFIAIGCALTCIALMALSGADAMWKIIVGYLLLQVADDIGTGPYSALIPELVPEEHRGRASGFMGLQTLLAQLFIGLTALVLGDITKIYILLAILQVIAAFWVIYTIRGAEPVRGYERSELAGVGGFLRGWVEPWKIPDFFWVWFTRFLNAFGFYFVVTYLQFYLGDIVKTFSLGSVTFKDAGEAAKVLALVIALLGAFGATWAARHTDRLGRKKVIYLGGTIMSLTLFPFALVPNFSVIVVLAVIFGVGYGMYLSADWALVSDILPKEGNVAKDMGVWQMSNSVVQIFTGAAGAMIDALNQGAFGRGYSTAFLIAGVLFFLSTVLVRQVKGST